MIIFKDKVKQNCSLNSVRFYTSLRSLQFRTIIKSANTSKPLLSLPVFLSQVALSQDVINPMCFPVYSSSKYLPLAIYFSYSILLLSLSNYALRRKITHRKLISRLRTEERRIWNSIYVTWYREWITRLSWITLC